MNNFLVLVIGLIILVGLLPAIAVIWILAYRDIKEALADIKKNGGAK